MKRVVLCFAASLVLLLSSVPVASAATFEIRAKWRSCQTTTAALSFRTTFSKPASWHGDGTYLIKSQIRWDKYASGSWRKLDVSTNQTPWTEITNPEFDLGLSHGDRTNWGNLFERRWRAHVIVKLIKNRPGPKDNRVDIEERFFEKPMFDERAKCDEGVWLP